MIDFRNAAEEYLAVRRALGFQLARQGALLLKFADQLDAAGVQVLTSEVAYSWAREAEHASVTWQSQRLSVVRGFARHLQGIDPRTEIPSFDLIPAKFRRAVPHLYTDTEIDRLMNATDDLTPVLRAASYRTLIGLLAVTGMRVGEALGLDRPDIEEEHESILIRHGKGGKQRRIPVHPSTLDALAGYARLRDEHHPHPRTPESVFLTGRGTRPDYGTIYKGFAGLRAHAGLDDPGGSSPPRLHDLRHTFVLRTLLAWYRAGSDVEAQLPLLSAYLGHVDPVSTYWYFQAEPQLLALAAGRLERAWRTPA
jgi:integrase/recombinase XerD